MTFVQREKQFVDQVERLLHRVGVIASANLDRQRKIAFAHRAREAGASSIEAFVSG